MIIIHFGPEDLATSWQRIQAFRDLGHTVYPIHYSRMGGRVGIHQRIYRALWRMLGYPSELCEENSTLLQFAERFQPDLVFVEKGLTLRPHTLEKIKKISSKTVLACYSLDDMMNPNNQSSYYLKNLPLFDVHFTSKTYNIPELLSKGAQCVELTGNAYSPHVHRPVEVPSDEQEYFGSDVAFVGGFEKERAATLNYLARNSIRVRVWGNNWDKFTSPHPGLILEKRPVWADDYGKVVCSSKILLGFLRKINRDVETTRTMEIPAFGAFLLAERTVAQQKLFAEGVEAEYFGDDRELLMKIRFYLENDERRRCIAQAGRERCLRSGYSYDARMQELLNFCYRIKPETGR